MAYFCFQSFHRNSDLFKKLKFFIKLIEKLFDVKRNFFFLNSNQMIIKRDMHVVKKKKFVF